MQLEYALTVAIWPSKYKIMASFAKTVALFLMWRKTMMSEHSCRSVCGYYDANAEFRNSKNPFKTDSFSKYGLYNSSSKSYFSFFNFSE